MRDFKTLGEPFKLSQGSHKGPQSGMCVMEMASFLNGEEWSDTPECVCPVIGRFCQGVNDKRGQDFRDKLQTYMFKLMGSRSPEHEQERAEFLAWTETAVFARNSSWTAGLVEQYNILKASPEAVRGIDLVVNNNTVQHRAAHAAATAAAAAATRAGNAGNAAAYAAAYEAYDVNTAVAAADIFEVLDGVLNIGPSGENLPTEKLISVRAGILREQTEA